MCFSTESSLIAWAISVIIACYLWNRNRRTDRWNAAFIFTFSLIQLWEAGIWYTKAYESPTSETGSLFVKLIVLSLLLQPIIQSFFGYKYSKQPALKYLTWLYLLIFAAVLCYTLGVSYKVSKGPSGHLEWSQADGGSFMPPGVGMFYLLGLMVPLLFALQVQWPVLLVGVLTAVWSFYRTRKTGEFASLWCFTAVAYAVAALFV